MATVSTLQLVLGPEAPRLLLRSWDPGDFHQFAVAKQRLKRNMFLADIGPVNGQPRQTVIVKIAFGAKIQSLKHEHRLYKNQLAQLQGSYVPRCYGLFSGFSGNLPFGCLLLEYIEPHTDMVLDPEEFHRRFMFALCEIHRAGVEDRDLEEGHVLQKGYSPCIIDFSNAVERRCGLLHAAHGSEGKPCKELLEADRSFLITKRGYGGLNPRLR